MHPSIGAGMHPSIGDAGMVSSAHPLATDAGRSVLAAGGNAFDAAVAVAAALGVVEPMMSGIGGYGTIMVYDATTRRAQFLNSSGRIPRTVDSDVYRAPTPGYMQSRRGAKAVSTPGNVNAWEALWRGRGQLAWPRLFEPAIQLAESGFDVSELTASRIANAFDEFPAHTKAFYGIAGRPLQAGERLLQRDLGRSLRMIARDGASTVHGGALGMAIDSAMRAAGGFLTIEDLRDNRPEWWDPISITYRGHEIVTASPPANAFDALVRLGIMSRFEVRALGHNSQAYLHRFAEATKHGFWVRLRWAGDPDVSPPPVERLLSESYRAEQATKLDTLRASAFIPPASFSSTGEGEERLDGHTTHFVIADRWGNVVSATQTLGNLFGARIMPKGTGIWLNNSLAYSTFEPKGNPMDAHAGRRKLSGDVPVLVMRDGRVWAALGTPGGHSIGQTVPQMLMNLIDFGMDIKEALSAPRISFIEPDVLAVEERISVATRDALVAMGHNVREVPGLGNAHGLTIEYDSRGRPVRFVGAADPRGEGLARGFTPAATGSRAGLAQFPITPEIVVDGQFRGAEGIAFSGEGRMFVTADRKLWEVLPSGATRRVAELGSTVGLAGIGARDVLVAEFGPLVRLSSGANGDGVVLRITPEGRIDTVASGIGDPNFILVRRGNTLLVSDDFTEEIWEVMGDGQLSIFTRAVNHPNGMVEAADGKALYVAQIFRRIDPIEQDDRLWRIPLTDGRPSGAAEVVFRTGGVGGLDGLAMDERGRVYIAANREGRLWRFDPRDGSAMIIAEDVPGIASLAFGAGAFDERSLYATQLRGGRIWRFRVGTRGMPLVR